MFVRFAVPSFESILDASDAFGSTHTPPVDVAENENETVVVAEVPGMSKESLKITLDQDLLTIAGERKAATDPEKSRFVLREQRTRSFVRSLRVGHLVDRAAVSASLENGLLRIVLPKAQEARPQLIEVKVA